MCLADRVMLVTRSWLQLRIDLRNKGYMLLYFISYLSRCYVVRGTKLKPKD